MRNVIKIVFLGIVGFAGLVYLTLPKIKEQMPQNRTLTLQLLPKYFDVVTKNPYTKQEEIFKKEYPLYFIVLNHDSLAVFKDLYKKTQKNIVLIANISNTPWLIKQIAVNGELENMYKDSKISLINDSDGAFIKSLNLFDNSQNSYFVYKIFEDETIEAVYKGSVKKGALQEGIKDNEIDDELNKVLTILN